VVKSDHQGARSCARDLIVQSLYQIQIAGHDEAEVRIQFRERTEYQGADHDYYNKVLSEICYHWKSLEKSMEQYLDRPIEQLDPVEKGILMLGLYELKALPELPFKVVINESVNLAKRFGAIDGHKYINAVLDRAVKEIRSKD
tara:strand:- start:4950 stop:5378 length:429 start_codon:yes stop_codon:yes gene_type:complete